MSQENVFLQKSRESMKSNNRRGQVVCIRKYQALKAYFSCSSGLSQHLGVV